MKPIIGLDCQKILSPTGSGAGVEHYVYHLANQLAQNHDRFCDLCFCLNPRLQDSQVAKQLQAKTGVRTVFWPQSALERRGWWPYTKYRRQANFLRRQKFDLLHGPANVTPLFYQGKTVVTVHDLIIYEHPEWFPGGVADWFWRHSLVPQALARADKIIAVSKFTKQQIIRHFRIDPEKIVVIYEGMTTALVAPTASAPEKLPQRARQQKFLLYVGTVEPRKNLPRLIEAFGQISNFFPDLNLVIAGKMGWKYEPALRAADQLTEKSRVIFTDYITQSQKEWLYQHALGFVYPSLAEGFGLPVLDAMANKIPVVTSNVSSLPEVAGSAAIFVDPYSVASIGMGMTKLVRDADLRQKLITAGLDQARKFSWEQNIKQTLAVYQTVLN